MERQIRGGSMKGHWATFQQIWRIWGLLAQVAARVVALSALKQTGEINNDGITEFQTRGGQRLGHWATFQQIWRIVGLPTQVAAIRVVLWASQPTCPNNYDGIPKERNGKLPATQCRDLGALFNKHEESAAVLPKKLLFFGSSVVVRFFRWGL